MSDDPTPRLLAEVDDLVGCGRRRDRMAAARLAAIEAGRDPDLAAAAAAVERRPPVSLAGLPEPPGVSRDGWQHPTVRKRIECVTAAIREGRVTPAEGPRFFEAMSADEAAATKLLAAMPEGRLPLEPRAHVPDPENPAGMLSPGQLPDALSLLSRDQRAEIEERRR